MTREGLKKEAQEQVNCCTPIYPESFIQGYLAGAEPREKRIADLEQKLEQIEKDLADYQFNYPTIKELEKENAELERLNSNQVESLRVTMLEEEKKGKRIEELEEQIEKMKRHCNCKHRDSEGYCEVKRTYLMDLSYDGCDKWELEETGR